MSPTLRSMRLPLTCGAPSVASHSGNESPASAGDSSHRSGMAVSLCLVSGLFTWGDLDGVSELQ
jgi:hypothetical protein